MSKIRTDNLTPMQAGRLNAALDKRYRWSDGAIKTLREFIEGEASIAKQTGDGMIDFNRRRFNNMDGREQRAYEARLKAKRYFYLNNQQVPKIVFDAVAETQAEAA